MRGFLLFVHSVNEIRYKLLEVYTVFSVGGVFERRFDALYRVVRGYSKRVLDASAAHERSDERGRVYVARSVVALADAFAEV